MLARAVANWRVLIVDKVATNHVDLKQMLGGTALSLSGQWIQESCFDPNSDPSFQTVSVLETAQALELIEASQSDEVPFAVAFVNVGSAPEWEGLESAIAITRADSDIFLALCADKPDGLERAISHNLQLLSRSAFVRLPYGFEAKLTALSMASMWERHRANSRRRESDIEYIGDAERVIFIEEKCLIELKTTVEALKLRTEKLETTLRQRTEELLGTRDLTMFALAQLADSRDPETGEHLLRMRAYAQLIAEYLSKVGPYADTIDGQFLANFYRSTPLHDIGKVGIPDQILLKPSPLTSAEFDIMKCHTIIGAEAIEKAAQQSIYGGFLTMAAEIARHHHEKFDGTGYPHGLCGREIPLSARITALADVFDALTSSRVYKEAIPPREARTLIERESGRHFDPVVVDAFRACFERFVHVKQEIDGKSSTTADGNDVPAAILLSSALLSPLTQLTISTPIVGGATPIEVLG